MLGVFFLVCFGVAAFGAQFQPGPWYASLDKPTWTPPSVAFPIAWSLLYAMMAVAGWRVWATRSRWRRTGLYLFAAQLAANGLWSWLFFGLQNIGLALIDILVLWGLIAAATRLFARIDRWAAGLFVPYLLWVSYAVLLNAAIWQLNPPVD